MQDSWDLRLSWNHNIYTLLDLRKENVSISVYFFMIDILIYAFFNVVIQEETVLKFKMEVYENIL